MVPFSKHVSREEACSLVAPVQNEDYLTFFFPLTFPHGPHAPSLSHKYPEALAFRDTELRFCPPVSSLSCPVNKSFLCCKPWLAGRRANEPGSVTFTRGAQRHTPPGMLLDSTAHIKHCAQGKRLEGAQATQ